MSNVNNVRTLRKRFALTQSELADLLALSQTMISRLEGETEAATLETALALQVIFDASPRTLFVRLYETVEEAVMARAAVLDGQVRARKDPASIKKQRLLAGMAKRSRPVALRA